MAEPVGPGVARSLPDEAATDALGAELARALPANPAGMTILLQGELGAGKSTLARALLRTLGHRGPVPSPTYTLVEPYELDIGSVYHVDLYRIAAPDELAFLGWDELADGLTLVEWPERVPEVARQADLAVRLRYAGSGREADLVATSRRGAALLDTLAGFADPVR